ncbi:MAG: HAMP domain-containing histidine kinase [Bacteroidaceae bacterium]|jgi:signal transduction histidine kinase|nr:HAMP domain-containing histidine kinase [Bacteroidaceae bacterium]
MRKTSIIISGVLMALSLVSLLGLQVKYVEEIVNMRREHFNESVEHSLYQATHELEVSEARRYLEHGTAAMDGIATAYDSVIVTTDSSVIQHKHQVTARDGSVYYSLETHANTNFSNQLVSGRKLKDKGVDLKKVLADKYNYEKGLVDEVIYSLLYTASDRPLDDRIDFKELDHILTAHLHNNGIDIPYHFEVLTSNGRRVYACPDFASDKDGKSTFSTTIFKNDPVEKMGVLKINFPTLGSYIYSSLKFIVPALIFTLVLIISFIVTLVLIFRQRRLSEMKNDFINNMTHEFKTPISTISLAAQMLNDKSLPKSPSMLERLSTTIMDETKRLRFQVEKVLQVSLYENQKANFKLKEINANELIAGVVHTFALKVEKNGGKIISDLKAKDSMILADDMHFTNVMFNLMDNAVKYRREDVSLELKVCTWNEGDHLLISIQDNGIGIKKDDLKKVFEKFYRVHRGNLHDAKGFGLGLAYVKKIITEHNGTIHAESELGIGTKFIIKLLTIKNE